jgi:threonine/homoserine/homoserine lactone efflux protein
MTVQAIISGLTLGLILAFSVGPVIFTIIKQSLNNGYAGGFSFVCGVWVSDILMVFISNAFSELVKALLEYKRAIGAIGSVFLLLMGLLYLFFKKVTLHAGGEGVTPKVPRREMLKIFSSGFLINTLNPNVIIFWLGVATAVSGKFDLSYRIIIFSLCLGVNMLADVLKVLLAGRLRSRLTFHSLGIINKISGSLLIFFALLLFYGTFIMPS